MDNIIELLENYSGLQFNDLMSFLALGVISLLTVGLISCIAIAVRNSIRDTIYRETELLRKSKEKEIELMQAQIDYYNEQNNKTTSNNT